MSRRRAKPRFYVLLTLLGLIAAGIIVYQNFVVREIQIIGLQSKDYHEVSVASGITMGEHLLSLDRDAAKAALERDPYLRVESVTIQLPSSVIIRLQEKKVCAVIEFYRSSALVDESGFVLETRNVIGENIGVPIVTGIAVNNIETGKVADVVDKTQLLAMQTVLKTLEARDMVGDVTEINVSNLEDIVLLHKNGLELQIGDRENLDVKLNWIVAAIPDIEVDGRASGILTITSGKYMDYKPLPLPEDEETEDMPEDDLTAEEEVEDIPEEEELPEEAE